MIKDKFEKVYIKKNILFRNATCRACRRNMENEAHEGYQAQLDEMQQEINFEISRAALDIMYRVIGMTIYEVDGKTGHELWPYLQKLHDLLGEDKQIPDYEEELFKATGVMVVVTDDGVTHFGTKQDYLDAGWDWPEGLDKEDDR